MVDGAEVSADISPWGDVIRDGKVVRLRSMTAGDDHQPGDGRITLGIPVLARGDVLGMLVLADLSETWARQDRQPFLEALANLVAHVLDDGALYRDLVRQKEELCTLVEVSRDITASLDFNDVLRRVVRHAARLLQGHAATLMLCDEISHRLHMRATYGTAPTWLQCPPLGIGRNFIGEVIRSGSPLAVLDIQDLPSDAVVQMANQEGLRSLLCVPVQTGLRLIGLLTVYTVEPRRFREAEVELLLALAGQSAIAIENARLYRAMLEAQEQLRQSERLAALGSMSAGLAHEIRNPLHTMLLLVSAMQKDCPRSTTLEVDLAVIQNEIGRLTLLVDQCLDVARPKHPEVSPQKLPEIMEETLLLVTAEARRQGVRIRKTWPRDLPLVWVDGAQIKQVFLNVLLNALQATASGRAIEVRMAADTVSMITEIQDHGDGIPADVKAHLFTPFFTTKPKGIGLGLSISQRLIDGHRGAIRVMSQEGEGTTVRIVLPLTAEKVHEKNFAG
jgi:signal transduction histidine kinase